MIMLSFFGAIREILTIIAAYAKRKELLNGLYFVEKTDREIIQEAICYVNACKADKFDPFSE